MSAIFFTRALSLFGTLPPQPRAAAHLAGPL